MSQIHVVFGANGGSGKAIVRELIARGKQVRAITRSGSIDQDIAMDAVEVFKADAMDSASTKAACQGASVVYHAANVSYQNWHTALPPMLDAILEGAATAGAKLVYIDNTYMYGRVTAPMTEKTPSNATDRKGQLRAELAAKLLQAHKSGKIQATIARGTNFYGPEILNSVIGVSTFQRILQGKKAMWLGRLDVLSSQSYIQDFARGAVTLGERTEALGRPWHIPTAPALTGKQFLELAFAEAHMPAKIGAYTRPVMQLIAPFNPLIREVVGTLYQYEAPYVLDSSDYTHTFGDFTPTSHATALHETLAWVRTLQERALAAV